MVMVELRDVLDSDLPIFFEFQQEPEGNRMQAFLPPDSDDRAAFLEKWRRIIGDPAVSVATIVFEGRVAGSINAFLATWSGKREVGYRLGREFWGKGVASGALKLFLKREAARPLFAQAACDNLGSIRVLEKSGFRRYGTVRSFANARGEEIDEVKLRLDDDTDRLLKDLANTIIGLAPSAIHGIGVFALADIPAGKRDLFSLPSDGWRGVPLAEVESLPAHVRKLLDTYCLQDTGMVYLPPHGFKIVDLVQFLNHSDTPNLQQLEGGNYFVALRDIAAGEELTIDYGALEVE